MSKAFVTAVSRLGDLLRTSWSNPQVRKGVADVAVKYSGKVPNSIGGIKELFQKHPDAMWAFLTTSGFLVADVASVFVDDLLRDHPEAALAFDAVMGGKQQVYGFSEMRSVSGLSVNEDDIRKAMEADQVLGGLSLGKKEDRDTIIAILRWAKRRFGSESAVIEAHAMMQAFTELSHETVVEGLRYLKVE